MTGLVEAVRRGGPVIVNAGGSMIELDLLATERQRKILVAGGLLNFTRSSM